MIDLTHKIELKPNNKQKTYFRKAFGCARFAYNWGLAEWIKRYEAGEKVNAYVLKKSFNAIKKEQFPFVLEVTKYATQQPFINLGKAFSKFFEDLKKGVISYPKFKQRKDNKGSFYIGGDLVALSYENRNSKKIKKEEHNKNHKYQYLKVSNLGWVRMTECLRFECHIHSVVISQVGEKFFAAFNVRMSEEEYKRTHPNFQELKSERKVGIDLGLKSLLILSDGVEIANPNLFKKNLDKVKKIDRRLNRKVHARTKQEKTNGLKKSKNFLKLSRKKANEYRKIANKRKDYIEKVSTILTDYYSHIAMEGLLVPQLVGISRSHLRLYDASFGMIRKSIESKMALRGGVFLKADIHYPSSKTCSSCGMVKERMSLDDRVYRCDNCGMIMDRDLNASRNLLGLIEQKDIGVVHPEFRTVDLNDLFVRFEKNNIKAFRSEAVNQQALG